MKQKQIQTSKHTIYMAGPLPMELIRIECVTLNHSKVDLFLWKFWLIYGRPTIRGTIDFNQTVIHSFERKQTPMMLC